MRISVLFVAVALLATPRMAAANELEIVHLRVGQGSAALIRGPADAQGRRVSVLYDAGNVANPDGGALVRDALVAREISQLDYVIFSHDHPDHMGGIAFGGEHGSSFVLGADDAPGAPGDDDGDGEADWLGSAPFMFPDPEELGSGDDIRVRFFVDFGDAVLRDTEAIRKYQGIANAMGERITVGDQSAVDSFEIDLGGGARMIAYASNGYVRGRAERVANVDTPNERCLAFVIRYGDFDYFIGGDLHGRTIAAEEAEVERAVGEVIAAEGFKVDVLAVNHHGGDDTSSAEFLHQIEPTIAIISAGNGNRWGLPALGQLERLVEGGVSRIIQTEYAETPGEIPAHVRERLAIYQDDVIVRSNGSGFEVSTSRWFPAH